MVEILFGIAALPERGRLASADLVVVLLIILRINFWLWAFITADCSSRVFLLTLLLNWSELLVDPALVARPDEVVLGR